MWKVAVVAQFQVIFQRLSGGSEGKTMQNRNEDSQYFGQDLTTTKHNTAKHSKWNDLLWQMSGHIMAD